MALDDLSDFPKHLTKARLAEAAIEAEYETGEHEATEQEARSHIAIRVARMSLGLSVVILGIAMMVLPGPGVLAIAGGLFILAKDVAWADRLLRTLRRKVPGIPDDGKIPRSQVATMTTMTLGAVALSTWFATR